jgi:hypothetical protein
VRDRRTETLRAIREVDNQLRITMLHRATAVPQARSMLTARLDGLLDRRLELMLRLEQLTHLGFLVTDRRRIR